MSAVCMRAYAACMYLSSRDCSRPLACSCASMSGLGTEAYHKSVTQVACTCINLEAKALL